MSLAVVIVNYRTPELTERCLAALAGERAALPELKAVVVDGGSGDGSASQLTKFASGSRYADWVTILPLTLNGGFGWANNQAILTLARESTPPEFIHLLNPDTEIEPGAVAALVDELRAFPRCAAAGSQLLDSDGAASASAFRFPSPGRELLGSAQSDVLGRLLGIDPIVVRSTQSVDVDWVTGASVMLRAEALRENGLFDDGFFLYFEEVELMHRLRRAGWTVRHVPRSRVAHLEGAATGLGAGARARALPAYWYQSRRRYFALTGGRRTLWAANLASFAGKAFAAMKRLAGKPPSGQSARVRDLVRYSSRSASSDVLPARTAWGDPTGKEPAWMTRR